MKSLVKPSLKSLIPTTVLLIILLFSTATMALASGGHEETTVEQDHGSYNVVLKTDPQIVIANDAAKLQVIVTNKADGKPVTDAKITIQSTMEDSSGQSGEMSGMDSEEGMAKPIQTVMNEQSAMSMSPGTYTADITFSQPGHWDQAISVSSPLGTSSFNIPISVANSGPNYVFLGVVAGLVVISGIVAGIIKKKHLAENGGTL